MDKKEIEAVNYKKEYRKSLHRYITMMYLANIYCITKNERTILFALLDERQPNDLEWKRIEDQDRRIREILSKPPFYTFDSEYPVVLRDALDKIKIMSN